MEGYRNEDGRAGGDVEMAWKEETGVDATGAAESSVEGGQHC